MVFRDFIMPPFIENNSMYNIMKTIENVASVIGKRRLGLAKARLNPHLNVKPNS